MPNFLPSVRLSCLACHSRFSSCSTHTSFEPLFPYLWSISRASAGSSIQRAVCLPKESFLFPVLIPSRWARVVLGTTINLFFFDNFFKPHFRVEVQRAVHRGVVNADRAVGCDHFMGPPYTVVIPLGIFAVDGLVIAGVEMILGRR